MEITDAIKSSFSIADVLRKLNLIAAGGNYKTINKFIKDFSIDTSHFSGQLWSKGKTWENIKMRTPLEEILVEHSNFNSNSLKKRLFSADIKSKQCESCNLTEWLDSPIALELHHINGINTDNRIENLQVLCPNCHARTDNYRGRNQKRKTDSFEEEKNTSVINHTKKEKTKINCLFCNKEFEKSREDRDIKYCSKRCKASTQPSLKPMREQLIEDFAELKSYKAVSRKYGVSDNAVRKWAKSFSLI